MKIRHHEIQIDSENPFANCKLERQKYAEILTDVVGSYPDGFVLAINNEWGTGKTTFVKMWQQHLINRGYKTVYFNAWENDFSPDPLVAIMSELKTIASDSKGKKAFDSALQKGAVLAKAVLPAAAKGFAKAYGLDVDGVASAVEGTTKAATDIFEKEVDEYAKKKKTIVDFRIKLAEFAAKVRGENTLVFIIDELDRCRPHYAVEVLEQIKHLFAVSGITFVLSIDKGHLAASVRGFYGSEQINTEEYLRRFIDLEYSIPNPSIEQFCTYLYEYYEFDQFFGQPERIRVERLRREGKEFLKMASILFSNSNSTLRQIERVFGHGRLVLQGFGPGHLALSDTLFVLVYMAAFKPMTFSKLRDHKFSLQELCDECSELFPNNQSVRHLLIYVQARLLVLYDNEIKTNTFGNLLKKDEGSPNAATVTSKFDTEGREFTAAIQAIYADWDTRDLTLNYLLEKVTLTKTFN